MLQNSLRPGFYLSRSRRVLTISLASLATIWLGLAAMSVSAQPTRAGDPSIELRDAVEMLRRGKPDAAEPLLRHVLVSNPKNADAHNLLGVILDQRGQTAAAEHEYQTALSLNPRSISARANLGVLQARLGRDEAAIELFEGVLSEAPDHPQANLNLGLLYAARGDYLRSLPFLEKVRAQQPTNLPVLAQLGFAFYQLKRTAEAAEVLASANSLAPSDPNILYLSGLVATLRGDAEAAVAFWQRALEQRPAFAAANFMIGEELRKQRRYEGAVEFYQRALDQDPGQLAYYVRPAGMFMLLTRYDRALELFQKAAQRFPKSAEAQYFVGIAARGLANLDLAAASFRKSLALKDGNVDALAQLGFVLDERGQIAEAEKVLRRAVASDARHFFANYDLGRVLVHAKRYEEAIDVLIAAGQIRPRDPGVHYQLFMAYTRLKRKDDADQELKLFKQYEAERKSQRSDPNAEIEDSLPRPDQDKPN